METDNNQDKSVKYIINQIMLSAKGKKNKAEKGDRKSEKGVKF